MKNKREENTKKKGVSLLLFPFAKTNSEKKRFPASKTLNFNLILLYVVYIYHIYIYVVKENMIIGRPKQFYTVLVQIYFHFVAAILR